MVVQLDEVINQAQATKGALAAQRSTFMEVQSKLKQLGDRFPAIRGILGTLSYPVYCRRSGDMVMAYLIRLRGCLILQSQLASHVVTLLAVR